MVSAELPPIKGFLSLLNADPSTFAEIKIKDKNVHTTKTKIIHTNRNPNYDFSVVLLVKERIHIRHHDIYLMHIVLATCAKYRQSQICVFDESGIRKLISWNLIFGIIFRKNPIMCLEWPSWILGMGEDLKSTFVRRNFRSRNHKITLIKS